MKGLEKKKYQLKLRVRIEARWHRGGMEMAEREWHKEQ